MQGCSPRGLRWCLCFRPSMFTNHNFFGSFSPQCLQTTISLFLSALNVCLQIFWFFRPSMFINHNFFGSFSPQCLQTTISLFLSALHVYKPQFPYFFRPSMFATLLVLLAIDVCKPFGLLAIDVCKPSGSFGHQCLQTFWFFRPSMFANLLVLSAIDVCKPFGSFGHRCLQTFWFFWPSMFANLLVLLAINVCKQFLVSLTGQASHPFVLDFTNIHRAFLLIFRPR